MGATRFFPDIENTLLNKLHDFHAALGFLPSGIALGCDEYLSLRASVADRLSAANSESRDIVECFRGIRISIMAKPCGIEFLVPPDRALCFSRESVTIRKTIEQFK